MGQRLAFFQLKDGWIINAAHDGGQRPDRHNLNDVARQQAHITRFIAAQQKVIQVQLRDRRVIAAQDDAPHRAFAGRTAGGEQSAQQGAH